MSGTAVQRTNDDLVNWLTAHFQGRYEPQFGLANYIGMGCCLSQLRGFWPMSSVDENGDVYDLSRQGRTLTNNNMVAFGVEGIAPYSNYVPASTQYLSRPDEAGLDITGALTICGWLYADGLNTNRNVMGKMGNGFDYGYLVYLDGFDQVTFTLSTDGFNLVSAFNNVQIANQWAFFACRFTPSTELAVFVGTSEYNLFKETNTTSIPATIFNSTASFMIGWANSATFLGYYSGKVAGAWLYAAALSDAAIFAMYQQTRPLFNV